MIRKPASFDQRLLAQSIDITLLLPVLFLLDWIWEADSSWFWVVCLLMYHVYAVVTEASSLKGTLGKKIVGLTIEMDDGHPADVKTIIIRNAGKWVSLLPASAGFFLIYFRRDAKTWHDLFTQSRVVRAQGLPL